MLTFRKFPESEGWRTQRKTKRITMNPEIGTAVQAGDKEVHVYSPSGELLMVRSGDLTGYSSSTVSIRRDGTTYVYYADGGLQFLRTLSSSGVVWLRHPQSLGGAVCA